MLTVDLLELSIRLRNFPSISSLLMMFGRNQHNSVKQLSFNWKINLKLKKKKKDVFKRKTFMRKNYEFSRSCKCCIVRSHEPIAWAVLSHFSQVWLFAILWTIAPRFLCPWNSPGRDTGMDCHALLQEIILAQGSNPWVLFLLFWQAGSLLLLLLLLSPFSRVRLCVTP